MSKRAYLLNLFKDIADAIRAKTGQTRLYEIEELPDRIMDISTGTTTPAQTKSVEITSNGNQIITPDDGYVLDKVNLSVSVPQNNRNNVLIETYGGGKSLYSFIKTIDLSNVDLSKTNSFLNFLSYFESLESIKFPNFVAPICVLNAMFQSCKSLKNIDLSFFQGAVGIRDMFSGCSSLESIKFGKTFDFSSFASDYGTSGMFYGCNALTSLDLSSWINTNTIKNMSNMFNQCSKLEQLNITSLDTSNVTKFSNMFYNCRKLTSLDLRHFDVSKATSLDQMFVQCSSLTFLNLDGWDTSNVTAIYYMFYECESLTELNVNHFNIEKCSSLGVVFTDCRKLKSLDLSNWNTSNIVSLDQTFSRCESLETLNVSTWDTSKVTKMEGTFNQCLNLDNLDLSSWNTDNVISMSKMFWRGQHDEKNVTFGTNWASNEKLMNFDMSYYNLTHDSALDLLNKLATRTNNPTLKFHTHTKPKLSADEIKIATDKGWVVS